MVILCMLHLKNSNHTFVKAAISLILSLCALTVKGALVSYHTLTEDDGLPTNAVLSVFKDHSGFMWIGTEKGLARFDGNNIITYPSTSGDEIWAIEEMDNNTLLYGTVADLKSFNRKTNEIKTIPLPASYVKSIKKIDAGTALIGTDNGLYVMHGGRTERVHIESGLSLANEITGIAKDGKSGYWLSTADGLVHYDRKNKSLTVFRMPKAGEKTNYFTCIAVAGNKVYLGSFNQGLFVFDKSTSKFSEIKGFDHCLIQTVSAVGDKVYVGTNGRGLFTYSLSTGQLQSAVVDKNRNNSLKSNTVTNFLYDGGLQWVATQFGGLSYTPRSKDKFHIFNTETFNSEDYRVTSFYRLPSGAKLIGTRDGLFYLDGNNKNERHYTIHKPETGLRSDIITYIDKIGDNVLVGTYGGGIHVFDTNTLSLRDLSQEDLFRYGCVFQFIADVNGDMWVATQEGLYQTTLDGKVKRHYNHINSELPTSIVRRIMFDSRNRLWIGTKFGIVLLDTKSGNMAVDPFDIPKKDHIRNIYCSRNGNIFICGTSGLSVIDPQLHVLKYVDKLPELSGQHPMSVFETEDGNYWIAMESGILEYHAKDSTVRKYQKQDGLPSMLFNVNSGIMNDSVLYFANEGGLVFTKLREKVNDVRSDKKPVIVSCAYNDTIMDVLNIGEDGAYVIPPDAHTVTFNISNMDYTLSYTNRYEYKLEGYDSDWQTLDGGYTLEYKDLPPGKYELFVRNGHDAEATSVKVVVRRSYVALIGVAVLAILICVIILYFLRKIWKLQKRIRHERRIFASVKKSNEEAQPAAESTEDAPDNPMLTALLNYMDNEKAWLNPKLSIKEVATVIGTTDIELSRLLHNVLNVNWATFVNTYRVNEVKKCIENGDLSRLTLKGLSEKCGFGSKTSFYRVFKNIAGMTPAEYCKQLGISVNDAE